jgi:hypothetical protein
MALRRSKTEEDDVLTRRARLAAAVREGREKWASGGELGHERKDKQLKETGRRRKKKKERERERWALGRKTEGRGNGLREMRWAGGTRG